MAAMSRLISIVLGFVTGMTPSSNGTFALNAAANWIAYSFVADGSKTLNKVRLFVTAVAGTLTGFTAELYSDNNGVPNVSLETGAIVTLPTGASWTEWQSFTTALTDGTMYWIVFKNTTATPASNAPTVFSSSAGELPTDWGTGFSNWGWLRATSTNSGSTWSVATSASGLRLEFSDATFAGLPTQSYTRPTSGTSATRATGKQETGCLFPLPANFKGNAKWIAMPLAKVGSPGALRYRLYNGTTLLGTTNAIPAASVNSSNGPWYKADFASPIAIDASMTLRVVAGDATAADASTAGYDPFLWVTQNDANSKALLPLGGMKQTIVPDNTAVSFTDTDTQWFAIALGLDTNGEFQAPT